MNIDNPTWSLVSPRCQCCSEQGALCFGTCPNCGHVIFVCDEVGTVFMDINNLEEANYGGLDDPTCFCSQCSKIHVSDFRNSTTKEIQALGFKPTDYR